MGLLSWKLQILAAGVSLRGLWSGPGCQKDQAGDCCDLRRAGESWPGRGWKEERGETERGETVADEASLPVLT